MDTLVFKTKSPLPELEFQYSTIWKIMPSDGKGYKEITLLGPRNNEDTFSLAIVIRFSNLAQSNINIGFISDSIISKKMKLPGFVLTDQKDLIIDGIASKVIETNFLSPKSLDKIRPEMMKIYEKRFLLIVKESLIELIYTGTQDVFSNYYEEVNNLISSIKFNPNRE